MPTASLSAIAAARGLTPSSATFALARTPSESTRLISSSVDVRALARRGTACVGIAPRPSTQTDTTPATVSREKHPELK